MLTSPLTNPLQAQGLLDDSDQYQDSLQGGSGRRRQPQDVRCVLLFSSLSDPSLIELLAVPIKSPSPELEIMETPKSSKHRLNPMFIPPSRSSTRIARKPMLFERKKMVQVDIAKEDTVKDLKVKVRLEHYRLSQ